MGTRPRSAALTTVSMLAILVGAIGAPVSAQSRSGPDQELLGRMSGRTRVGWNAETGHVGYLGGTANRPVASSAALGSPATARGAARAFVGRYGKLLGVTNPARELDVADIARSGAGRTFVRYQQTYRGIPVIAGELIVQTDRDRDIVSVGGEASPDLSVDTRPSIGASSARRLAVEATAKHEKVRARTLRAGAATLAIYDPRLTGDPTRMPVARLVWRVDVRSERREINEFVAIDADRGTTAAIFNQTPHADPPNNAQQAVCDANNAFAPSGEGTTDINVCDPGDPWLVPNPSASVSADVLGAFRGAEATYDFFAKRFGRNSLNNAGMTLISTVRFCHEGGLGGCPYANAFWNGAQMVYGEGYATGDDVAGHELTHGITEFSSGLLYFFQSGAINEAMSDIFGEFVDLTTPLGSDIPAVRWLMGEDIPIGALRNMKNPPAFGDPDRMGSPNYNGDPNFQDEGGVHSNSGVANKAAFLMTDGGSFIGQTITGLGIDKAAAIWYRVNNYLLSSGSDYNDLANALHQGCRDLVGSVPRNGTGVPSPTGQITAANCIEVDQVIAATQMRNEPPVAKVKHTTLCAPGKTPTIGPFNDPINANAGGWITNDPGLWGVINDYATSNPYAIFGTNETVVSNTWVRSPRITVPSNAFLAFRHYLNLEAGSGTTLFDGGLVEYAINPSGPWTDLRNRFVFNGYNGTVSTQFGSPIAGRQAFGGFSYGWAHSKANLSNLAGKKIYLRFRIDTDSTAAVEGWAIDDVRVYRCIGPDNAGPNVGKPKLDLAKTTVENDGTPIPVKISFTATDPSGIAATFLQHRLGGAPMRNIGLSGRQSKAITTTLPDSFIAQGFRAGARDNVDNVATNTRAAKIRAIQETGGTPAVVYTGAWSTEASANYFGGAARYTSAAGRRARVTVTKATDLAVVTTKGPNRGRAEIRVDGKKKATIDLYSPTWKLRQVVYAISFASPGTHTIEVQVLGTSNAASTGKRVDLDAFEAILELAEGV